MVLLLLFAFLFVNPFSNFLKVKKNSVLYCKNSDINNNNTKEVYILPIDFNNIIEEYDNIAIDKLLKHLPKAPETEEEIEEDSFEGFLRNEFYSIARDKHINFETYYYWRQRAGIILTKEEVKEVYDAIVEKGKFCNLMQFITINKIIDEGNAGEF